jgi:hypothetical protein
MAPATLTSRSVDVAALAALAAAVSHYAGWVGALVFVAACQLAWEWID